MLVPPLRSGDGRSRKLTSWERRELKRLGDQVVLPPLVELRGRRVRVEAPDQGSWFVGQLRSARRLQLCIELVLGDAEIGGKLRAVEPFTSVVTIIRLIGSVVVLEVAPTLTAIIPPAAHSHRQLAMLRRKPRRWWPLTTWA